MTQTWIQLIISIVLLYGTAELLVSAACSVARQFSISERVIGLTVIAFGTSAPEIMVCVVAALSGNIDVAVGNVVGSNICNIGLVLGGAAVIRPLQAARAVLTRDLPYVLVATCVLYLLAADGSLERLDGVFLLAGLAIFLFMSMRHSTDASQKNSAPESSIPGNPIVLLIVALVGIAVAAHLLVGAAVAIGEHWGISDLVIGLTIVALGTSLPEAATAWVGAARGKSDLTLGNILGSNIFNIGAVLGLTCLIRPLTVQSMSLGRDIPIALLFAGALYPMVRRSSRIGRRKGLVLVVGYIAYIGLLAART